MLYRNIDGIIIEINKNDFINDKIFYEKIMELKISFSKLYETNKSKKIYSTFIIDDLISAKNF